MHPRNALLQFLVGLVMLVVGFYWFATSVHVTSGFGWGFGGWDAPGGLLVVPFIVGVMWWFFNTSSTGAKVLTVLGLVGIVAAILSSVRFVMWGQNLLSYLIMLVFMFGGAALMARVLFTDEKSERERRAELRDRERDEERDVEEQIADLEEEIRDLRDGR